MSGSARWDALSRALRDLHRALVERARSDYQRENLIGGDIAPGDLLRLLTTDAHFEWLRGLSELMVDIDVLRDRPDAPQDAIAPAVRASVETFITAPGSTNATQEFAGRYWPYVQDDPHVAMAHAAVKRALADWPRAERDPAGDLDARAQVAQSARDAPPGSGGRKGT
jgi:hypothetical protein